MQEVIEIDFIDDDAELFMMSVPEIRLLSKIAKAEFKGLRLRVPLTEEGLVPSNVKSLSDKNIITYKLIDQCKS